MEIPILFILPWIVVSLKVTESHCIQNEKFDSLEYTTLFMPVLPTFYYHSSNISIFICCLN